MKHKLVVSGILGVMLIFGMVLWNGCSIDDDDKGGKAPSVPTNVTASAQSSSSIRVSWNSVLGAASYNVYRSSSESGIYTRVGSPSGISYTDSGLSPNTTYYYYVRSQNSVGESDFSSYASATTSSSSGSGSAPTGVTATAQSSSSIMVSWYSVSGAASYNVYRSASWSGTYSPVATSLTGTSYINSGLSPNTTWYYQVKAQNSAGVESNFSSYASATTSSSSGSGTAPSAPTGVTATAQSSSSIMVSWYSVSGAASYNVYRSTSPSGIYPLVGSPSGTSYTDTGLSPNTTYYYQVKAQNSAGVESNFSSYVSATTSSADITATVQSSSSIMVSWKSVSGARFYYLFRSTSPYGGFQYLNTTGSNEISYTDTGLSPNTTYYYAVKSVNSAGVESDFSSYASATTSSPPPSPPANITATAQSSSSIRVSWYSVSGVANYNVYRSTSPSGTYSLVAASLTGTSYTDTGLSPNTTYYYAVKSVNSAGVESDFSSYTYATTSSPPPSPPANITATVQSSSSITVSWYSVSGAATYSVYRSSSESGTYSLVVVSWTGTSYTDTGLSSHTTYYYKVKSVNSTGAESEFSSYTYAVTLY
jgi:fibronectin type 3 domain-containing protein